MKKEWTVKELHAEKFFPYRERMIWNFIKNGDIRVKILRNKKIRIPNSAILSFLQKIQSKHHNSLQVYINYFSKND